MPNEDNLNSGSNLEPIAGEPGWYLDKNTGQTVHESELGGLLDEDLLDDFDDEEDEDEYEQNERQDERQDEKKDQDSEEPEEGSSESTGEGAENPEGELGGEGTPAEAGLEEGASEGLAEGGAEAAGEAVAEEAALAAETEAVAAEAAAAAAETVAASTAEAGAAATSEFWVPVVAAIAIVVILVVIIFLAFMAFDKDEATADTTEDCGGGIIVIDPGHVSENKSSTTQKEYDQDKANGTGTFGTSTSGGLKEYDVNQKVADILKTELESKGYTAILTKTGASDFLSNRGRGQIARDKDASLIIKLHNDGDGPTDGIIFYHSDPAVIKSKWDIKNEIGEYPSRREDSIIAKDAELAKTLASSFKVAAKDYGIKYENGTIYPSSYQKHAENAGFGYTYGIPTSLVEMSSMKVTGDAKFISTPANYAKLAKAIADGIEDYMPPTGGDCGGITGLETPPGIKGPNSKDYYLFPGGLDVTGILYGSSDNSCNHWGSLELNQVVYTVAKKFAEKYPKNKMQIGDFNSTGHITHNDGRDADIDIPGGMMVDGGSYKQELAIYAAKLYFQTGTMKWIYYDDSEVATKVNAWAKENNLPGTVKPIGGHANHFHIRMQDTYAGATDSPSCP